MDEPIESSAVKAAWARASIAREKATFATANLLICVLVPLWSAFDNYLEPALAPRFLVLRLVDVVLTIALWRAIARSSDLARNRRLMSVSVVLVGVTIALMLPQAPAHYTLYAFGFSLVFWGCGLLLVWPLQFAVGTFGVILVFHLAVSMIMGSRVPAREFVGALFYLASAAIIAGTQTNLRRRLEYEAFRSSFALEARNAELAKALAELGTTQTKLQAALAADNARLVREAQEAVRVRDEFISIASHELRTPLNSLGLVVGLLARAEGLAPKSREHVEIAGRQVVRLTKLVDQLVDVSRLSAGRLTLEREDMDLAEVVREVAARFAEDAAKAGCALDVKTAAPVRGLWDRSRLDQVVANLVSNAIKYGGGKPVHLSLETDGRMALLRVADEGIGIEHAERERIFQRFERAESAKNYGGLGLGLWISRTFVEGLGGTIRVESEAGRGATFIVELPRAA